jgi:hypothetical protein
MASEIRSGMSTTELPGAVWRKSSRSGAVGNCVELAWLPTDRVALRNSRNSHGPALVYARADVVTFLVSAKKW